MYKITFYVPVTHVEIVKSAMFTAGAGQIGDYECCAWQILGVGQFRPLAGSSPFIGKNGTLEYVAEYKVEMVCAEAFLQGAVAALKQSHPYQVPAYDVVQTIKI
ncbi:MAG: NGG1p interacting factor NIF3 [Agitococcus sp.]|nr:NGG1p interacting factor NIF3 [Agitococcus sp.]MDO9178460.1 NGG1p interacting factor NIF3 [Agitococcus sp.]